MKNIIYFLILLVFLLKTITVKADIDINAKELILDSIHNTLQLSKNIIVNYKGIKLTSEFGKYLKNKQIIQLSGKVTLIKKNISLSCENLEANLQKLIFIAENKVKIKYENIDAQADKAIYEHKKQIIKLYGNIEAYEGKDRVTGKEIMINLAQKKLISKGKTKIIISPERLSK